MPTTRAELSCLREYKSTAHATRGKGGALFSTRGLRRNGTIEYFIVAGLNGGPGLVLRSQQAAVVLNPFRDVLDRSGYFLFPSS